MEKDKKEINNNIKEWYDDSNKISNIAIAILVIIIILSQAFAVKNNLTTRDILINLLNHNSLYLLGLIYFIPLKTKAGKKYFNYLNIFLIIVYFIFTVTSVLTIIQSFGLTSLIGLLINIVFLIYMIHNLLKDTRIWKEFKLDSSPFNEINNENYQYSIIVLVVIQLAINLIGASTFDGVVLSLLVMIYNCVLARFIYLYQIYLDTKKDKNNDEDLFKEIHKISKSLPKFKTVATEVTSYKLNNYQIISIVTFGICFCIGIIFGNLFPACGTTSGLYTSTCATTEFNFSLTLAIWFISFLVCVLFYGLGQIIKELQSINQKLEKKKK